jgi:hypothetical protein
VPVFAIRLWGILQLALKSARNPSDDGTSYRNSNYLDESEVECVCVCVCERERERLCARFVCENEDG